MDQSAPRPVIRTASAGDAPRTGPTFDRWTRPTGTIPGRPPPHFQPRPAQRQKPTRPTQVCWLRGTSPEGQIFEIVRAPDRPGVMTPLRGALGPEQATTVARALTRRGWTDVRIIRRRLDDPTPPIESTTEPSAAAASVDDEPLVSRFIQVGQRRLQITEVPPSPGVATARRGARLAASGDWAGARVVLREATEFPDAGPAVWRSLGVAQGRCGDWRFARRALEQAVGLGDEHAGTLLGEVHQIETLVRTAQRRAWDATIHRQLGLLLMAWERGDDALHHFERAVSLAPTDLAARMALGLELLCRGRWTDAVENYGIAKSLASDPEQLEAAEQGLAMASDGRMPDGPRTGPDIWEELLAAG